MIDRIIDVLSHWILVTLLVVCEWYDWHNTRVRWRINGIIIYNHGQLLIYVPGAPQLRNYCPTIVCVVTLFFDTIYDTYVVHR